MSVAALSWAFQQPLSGNEKCVLLSLADTARDDGLCWPSQQYIADKAYVSERTVRTILGRLEEAGYISRTRRNRDDGSRTSDLISLALTAILAGRPPTGNSIPTYRQTVAGQEPSGNRQGCLLQEKETEPVSREPVRNKPMRYKNRLVDPSMRLAAERLVVVFNKVTGRSLQTVRRDGTPSPHVRQVVGAILERENVGFGQWEKAIRNTFTAPPEWLRDRQIQLGDIFGDKAADHALSNTGKVASNGNGRGRYIPPDVDYDKERAARIALRDMA